MSRRFLSALKIQNDPPLRDYRSPATRLNKSTPKTKKQSGNAIKKRLQEEAELAQMLGDYQEASKAPKARARKQTPREQLTAHLLSELSQWEKEAAPAKKKYNTKPKPQKQQPIPYYDNQSELALYDDGADDDEDDADIDELD